MRMPSLEGFSGNEHIRLSQQSLDALGVDDSKSFESDIDSFVSELCEGYFPISHPQEQTSVNNENASASETLKKSCSHSIGLM